MLVVHLDTVYANLEDQGHRSRSSVKVHGHMRKNVSKSVVMTSN